MIIAVDMCRFWDKLEAPGASDDDEVDTGSPSTALLPRLSTAERRHKSITRSRVPGPGGAPPGADQGSLPSQSGLLDSPERQWRAAGWCRRGLHVSAPAPAACCHPGCRRPEVLLYMRRCSVPDVCVLAQSDLCSAIWCLCKPAVKPSVLALQLLPKVHLLLLQEGQTLHLTSRLQVQVAPAAIQARPQAGPLLPQWTSRSSSAASGLQLCPCT